MTKFDIIETLNSYHLTDSEDATVILTDIPNSEIFTNLISEFRDISWYNNNNGNFNEWYDYTFDELIEFLKWKWYYAYIPYANNWYVSF